MAQRRKRKKPRKRSPAARQVPRVASAANLITDTADAFSCSKNALRDFTKQCDDEISDAECGLAYNQIAIEMWREHPDAQAFAEVLAIYAAARQHHLDALTAIRERIAELAAPDALPHIDLDPVRKYQALIRDRMFPEHPLP